MIYADYSFYQGPFRGGLLGEEEFERQILRAGIYLDTITRGRAQENPCDAVQLAACAVAEALYRRETGGVAAETVGRHSVTYSAPAAPSPYEAARTFLLDTGMLYQGF